MLAAELDNARAALAWAESCHDDALVLRLAAGVGHVFLAAAVNAEYLERVLPLRDRVRADTLLAREGDDLRLLERLALAACGRGHWSVAARLIGHVDAAMQMPRPSCCSSVRVRQALPACGVGQPGDAHRAECG